MILVGLVGVSASARADGGSGDAGAAPAPSSADPQAPGDPLPKWGPFIDLVGQPGSQRSIGEGDLFAPLLQNDRSLLFTDLRTRFDDRGSVEGNFGLGVRHMLDSGWNLGAYGYFDNLTSAYGNTFQQTTFGAEALSLDWDFRSNLYAPLGDSVQSVNRLNAASIVGTSVVFRGGEEVAMGGFDGEIGWRVPLFAADALHQLRIYAGGYRFSGDDVPIVAGPRLRLDLTQYEVPDLWAGSRVSLGGEVQHDGPRGTQYFASVLLRIPLNFLGESERIEKLTAMEWRMEDPIVRDVDVVSQAGAFGPPETAHAANGGSITVLSSATTTGANLPTAIADAGANSTIVLSGNFNTNAQVTLQSGQTLLGAGTLAVYGPDGRAATLNATSGATITGNLGGSNYTLVMGNNSTLRGMTINNTDTTGSNALAVEANGISGAQIVGNAINIAETSTMGTAHGVDIIGGASNVTVSGNTITASGVGAIEIGVQVNNSSATVTGNSVSASGGSSNYAVALVNANILSGSSGNNRLAGSCHISAAGTGATVTFTNAAPCGP